MMEDTSSTTELDASSLPHRWSKLMSLLKGLKENGEQTEDFADDPPEASASFVSSQDPTCHEDEQTTTAREFIDDEDDEDSDCDVCSVNGSDIYIEDYDTSNNGETDETIFDHQFVEPKIRETIVDKESDEDIPCSPLYDACYGYGESRYDDCMQEEYENPNSKASVKEDPLQDILDQDHFNKHTKIFEQTLHSSSFQTDEDRNSVYDKWLLDLVKWERNRLMWLDEVSVTEGFDSTDDKDRTFLVKVDDKETNSNRTPPVKSKCQKLSMSDNDPDGDYWEAWYRLERLQQHKYMYEQGLPNWYEDLLKNQKRGDDEVLGASAYDKEVSIEDESYLKNELPHDVVLVYQFTDRNLWRKYHSCFKKGKFHS